MQERSIFFGMKHEQCFLECNKNYPFWKVTKNNPFLEMGKSNSNVSSAFEGSPLTGHIDIENHCGYLLIL